MEPKSSKKPSPKVGTSKKSDLKATIEATDIADSAVAQTVAEGDNAVTTGTTAEGQPVTVVMKPPKKRLRTLFAAILALLLIGGIIWFAVWFFFIYSNPERVTSEAIENFFAAEDITTTGEIVITPKDSDGNVDYITINFTNYSTNLENAVTADVSLSVDDQSYNVSLDAQVADSGDIYLKVTDLMKGIDQVLMAQEIEVESLDGAEQLGYEIAELVDNEWWLISLEELASKINSDFGIDRQFTDPVVQFYNCSISAYRSSFQSSIAKLYQDYRFLKVERDPTLVTSGNTLYKISFNYDTMADFVNHLVETQYAEQELTCYNDNLAPGYHLAKLSAEDFDEVSADELREYLPDNLSIFLQVTDFAHHLTKMIVSYEDQENTTKITLEFEYAVGKIQTPDSYRPVTDLIDELSEVVTERL